MEASTNPPSRAAKPPSRTALIVAMCRAVHALRSFDPKLFDDGLARVILGFSNDQALLEHWDNLAMLSSAPGFANYIALRSRYAEDELAAAMKRGVNQYVILGAGLDTFAYRRGEICKQIDVFEVDHPGSQEWKRQRVMAAKLTDPPRLHRVPVDFEQDDDLSESLVLAGFDHGESVFVSFLGVSPYLTREALRQTLCRIAVLSSAGCTLVMDFMPPFYLLNGHEREWVESHAKLVAEQGEPWINILTAEEMSSLLMECGFKSVDFLDRRALQRRYLSTRPNTIIPNYVQNLCAMAAPTSAGGSLPSAS